MSKAKFTVKGIDEIKKSLNNLDKKVANKIAKVSVDEAAEIILNSLKTKAPKAKQDSTYSYTFLDKETTRKGGTHQAKMGINSKNWDMTRGLWYHYWGFRSHGRDLWVDRAFDESIDDAQALLYSKLEKGIRESW